jgi:hypothetical protein
MRPASGAGSSQATRVTGPPPPPGCTAAVHHGRLPEASPIASNRGQDGHERRSSSSRRRPPPAASEEDRQAQRAPRGGCGRGAGLGAPRPTPSARARRAADRGLDVRTGPGRVPSRPALQEPPRAERREVDAERDPVWRRSAIVSPRGGSACRARPPVRVEHASRGSRAPPAAGDEAREAQPALLAISASRRSNVPPSSFRPRSPSDRARRSAPSR